MSLFGGSTTPRHSSPENGSPSTAQVPSSPPISDILEDEQYAKEVSYPKYDADIDDADDHDAEFEPDTGNRAASRLTRPNRFAGKASTWRNHTALERNIAMALEQSQAEDLAAHVYNAHALKRHVRLPPSELRHVQEWQSKDAWLKKGRELEYVDVTGAIQTELVPSKRWTAWPLPAREVPMPRSGEVVGEAMREEVLAILSRLAKERYMGRAAEAEDTMPSRRWRCASAQTAVAGAESEAQEDQEEDPAEKGEDRGRSASEAKFADVLDAGKPNAMKATLKPALSADDDVARRIMEPSINSLLARVDRLAEGIRRTRRNHLGKGTRDTSGSEATSGIDTDWSTDRSRPRSRAKSKAATRSKSTARPTSRAPSNRRKRLRQDDSDLDSVIDDHSISDLGSVASPSARKRRSPSINSENRLGTVKKGLLDWSEVLSIASMTGAFPAAVISRTAQRCANLFDEGTSFRVLDTHFANESAPDPIAYVPEPLPDLKDIHPPELIDPRRKASEKKHPYFDTGTLRCPHTDCPSHKQVFPIPYRVVEHVIRAHGYDPRKNDEMNEERRVDGLHWDGFLQPVTAKQGWLGHGRAKARASERPSSRPNSRPSSRPRSSSKGKAPVKRAKGEVEADAEMQILDEEPADWKERGSGGEV